MTDFVAYPSRGRIALVVLGAMALCVMGLWMTGVWWPAPVSRRYAPETIAAVGWVSVVFFGLSAVGWGKTLFDTGEQLRIGPSGIRWTRWSDRTIPWGEIRNVTVWSYRRHSSIVLHLRDPTRFPGKGVLGAFAGPNRGLTGGDITISLTGTDRSFAEAMAAIAHFRR